MSPSSTWRRPAVSTSTKSWPTARASSRADCRMAFGSFRDSGWWTFKPAWVPSLRSCSRAAGRCTSMETRRGCRPALVSHRPSLPVVVVFPEPCRPVMSTTDGRLPAVWIPGGSSPPRSATISSRTIRRTAWSGLRLFRTSWPVAWGRTRSTNCLATLKWTSASSRARRISRSAAPTWASDRVPCPRHDRKIPWSLSLRASNTPTHLDRGRERGPRGDRTRRRTRSNRRCYRLGPPLVKPKGRRARGLRPSECLGNRQQGGHLLVRIPEPARQGPAESPEELGGQARAAADQALDLGVGDGEDLAIAVGDGVGRGRGPVEELDLPEEIARPQDGQGLLPHPRHVPADPNLALGHQVQAPAALALGEDGGGRRVALDKAHP